MTVDDDNSVYVGGLPFNATEDTLRRAFHFYGHIVAVKIINDRGKCYGFVTFTNPRSAIDAINDMNGRNVDGRAVRVNAATTRGGRSNFGRDRLRRNAKRGVDWDRPGSRVRDYDRDRYSDRSREHSRSREHYEDQEREFEHAHDHDQGRDHNFDRDEDQSRNLEDHGKEYSRDSDGIWERDERLDPGRDREMEGTGTSGHRRSVDKDKDQLSRRLNGSIINDRHSRGHSSDSRDDNNDQVKEQVERSLQKREELKKEIAQAEERLKEKLQLVSDLQRKSKKLEDAVISAKKLSSLRQTQLAKLCKCFLQVKDFTERLKSCEQELQRQPGPGLERRGSTTWNHRAGKEKKEKGKRKRKRRRGKTQRVTGGRFKKGKGERLQAREKGEPLSLHFLVKDNNSLQSLVDTAMVDGDIGAGAGVRMEC
ncbi:RRM_1 domain-containing protein [Cephalotus follicularis]|uniref:RRM_1 domain-containing protein n=1 Tax=Cephalotus follicularis TaxID=3775 RepID=A0A1Q3BC65_CEPFO|nr:RRM_1 domain-containing protein [Cephalotus follicularis]